MPAAPAPAFTAAVQRLADIADARHAGELTMCSYLLQMREFFRWQAGLPLTQPLAREAVGPWIAAREALWHGLEGEAFAALPPFDAAGGGGWDPFDEAAVNTALGSQGWLYGAGRIGAREGGRPVFFLAALERRRECGGLQVLEAGREVARGLAAPPVALTGAGAGPIVVRREALARWGWQGYETHSLRRAEASAWHAVAAHYRMDDEGFEAALPRWLDDQVEIAVLHELGEHRVGLWLGAAWTAMRQALPDRRGELHAVAVRDHLADLTSTLPVLLERGDAGPLHAWFASFDGVRAALFPRLAAAYGTWRRGAGLAALHEAVLAGREHFEGLAGRVLRAAGDSCAPTAAEGRAAAAELMAPAAVCSGD
jgi:hypothetical protein